MGDDLIHTFRLKIWEEIIGILEAFSTEEDSYLILDFSAKFHVLIPYSIDMKMQLEKMIGKRIAILRTDIKENEYVLKQEG
jgi:hypothetical protein